MTTGADSLPGVSVIIPTHKRPELLRRAVASVLDQTYAGEIEVVVVFDAEEPYDPGVGAPEGRTVVLTRNVRRRGLAGGRNSGIFLASHQLVAFLDDDDEWRDDKLALQVPLMIARPDMPLSGAGMSVVSPAGVTERWIEVNPVTLADLVRDRIPELNACGIMVRRDRALGDLGLVDESIPGSYGEDYDLLIRAARLHPIAVVPDPVVFVHWHGGSFFGARWWVIIQALQYLLVKHPEFGADPRGRARITGQIAFAYAALGKRREARRWARNTLVHNPVEPRAVLALAVGTHLISTDRVLAELRKRGRGI